MLVEAAVVPPPTTTYTAIVRAVNAADNSFFGYIQKAFDATRGAYLITTGVSSALKIQFEVPTGYSTASQQNIIALNAPSNNDIPQVGGIYGYVEVGTSLATGSPE
jgi:hypothetical protein